MSETPADTGTVELPAGAEYGPSNQPRVAAAPLNHSEVIDPGLTPDCALRNSGDAADGKSADRAGAAASSCSAAKSQPKPPPTPEPWPELSPEMAVTFSEVEPVFLTPGTKLYRAYGGDGKAGPNGRFWTIDPPASVIDVRSGTAVLEEWNDATMLNICEVGECGLKAWQGPAAEQPLRGQHAGAIYRGGAIQVFVASPPPGAEVSNGPASWAA